MSLARLGPGAGRHPPRYFKLRAAAIARKTRGRVLGEGRGVNGEAVLTALARVLHPSAVIITELHLPQPRVKHPWFDATGGHTGMKELVCLHAAPGVL
jgi:hypothetical protein